MAIKSKWFRVAVAGDTTDGRSISSEWIEQMAENYNPSTYGARINVEHIRSYAPDSDFGAYGDVLALKTEKITINGEEKISLLAQIEPNEKLIELNKKKQKVYTSIEIDPNFAKTGTAYLVGLAITDSPASLGTEMLKFAASQESKNPFNNKKQRVENVICMAHEVQFEFEDDSNVFTQLVDKVKAIFSQQENKQQQQQTDAENAVLEIAQYCTKFQQQLDATQQAYQQLKTELEQLKNALQQTQNDEPRPQASGYSQLDIDC